MPSLRKSLFSSTRAYSCAGEKPLPVSFFYLFPHQDLFLGKNPLFLMHQQWCLCVPVRIIRPEMSGSVTEHSMALGKSFPIAESQVLSIEQKLPHPQREASGFRVNRSRCGNVTSSQDHYLLWQFQLLANSFSSSLD